MPKVLIQSYMLDAIWNGGILVLRGVTPGMSLGTFIRKRLMPLVHFKGAHARIEIDPNLFEQYHITRVPTMVITVHKNARQGCHAVLTHVNKTQVPYQRCLPVDAKNYWSLSGSVSTLWAFDKLNAAGAPTAVFRARMKGLHRQGVKNEPAFGGNWKTAPMPYSNSDIDALLAKAGRAQSAGGAIGAVDVINQLSGGEKPHV
jgi:type-F conjugative transfer system pilin assembly protein TrbC